MTKPGQPEHTPEPWEVGPHGQVWTKSEAYGVGVMLVADMRGWGLMTGKGGGAGMGHAKAAVIQEENARRIVACVNACNGLGTEELEHCKDIHDLASLLEYGSAAVARPPHPDSLKDHPCLRCGIKIGSGAHYQIDDGFQTGGPYCRSCYEVICNAKPAP